MVTRILRRFRYGLLRVLLVVAIGSSRFLLSNLRASPFHRLARRSDSVPDDSKLYAGRSARPSVVRIECM